MTVQVGDVLVATVRGTNNALGATQNVFQFRNVGSAVAEADALDDVITLLESIYGALGAILSTLHVIQDVRVINRTQNSDVGIGTFTDNTPGTDAGNRHPPQMSYVLTLKTANLSVRGRKFFGPCMTGDADTNGLLGGATLLALADAGDILTDHFFGVSTDLEPGVQGSNPNIWRPFSSFAVSLRMGVRRSRKFGVGI